MLTYTIWMKSKSSSITWKFRCLMTDLRMCDKFQNLMNWLFKIMMCVCFDAIRPSQHIFSHVQNGKLKQPPGFYALMPQAIDSGQYWSIEHSGQFVLYTDVN